MKKIMLLAVIAVCFFSEANLTSNVKEDVDYKQAYRMPVFKGMKGFPLPDIIGRDFIRLPITERVKKYKKSDLKKVVEFCKENGYPRYSNGLKGNIYTVQIEICNRAESTLKYYK